MGTDGRDRLHDDLQADDVADHALPDPLGDDGQTTLSRVAVKQPVVTGVLRVGVARERRERGLVQAGQRLFHFGDARQHAGLLATNRFVLQIDASDEVPALDIDAFDRWIDSASVDSFEYDQHYGNIRLRITRFYDRTRYHWGGRVHELLSNNGPVDTTVSRRRCDPAQLWVIHHKDETKPRTYLAGLAVQVMARPQESRWWHYLGRELFYHHWYESAIAALEQHASMEPAWPAERSQSLCFLGQSLEALKRVHEAKEVYRRAFTADPTRREPLPWRLREAERRYFRSRDDTRPEGGR